MGASPISSAAQSLECEPWQVLSWTNWTQTWRTFGKLSTSEFCELGLVFVSQATLTFRPRYFRQLQEISDSVTEATWDEEQGLAGAIQECKLEQNELEAKINTGRARHRYLQHLAKNQEEGIADEDDETCILCRNEFERGYITQWYARLLRGAAGRVLTVV